MVWDVSSGKCTETLKGHNGGIYHCAVSSTGKLIISCGSGEAKNVLLWQWPQKKVVKVLEGHRRSVHHVTFSGDSCYAATADKDGMLAVHDLNRGACVLQRHMHLGVAHGSAFMTKG